MKTQDKETPSKVEPASLKEARKRLGKTQVQIATEVGFGGIGYLYQVEKGIRPIPKTRIKLFAKAYGVTVEQLSKLWVKKPTLNQLSGIDSSVDVLPIIKTVARCGIPQLTLSEFSRLLENTSRLQKCTPGLVKEILACGFK